MPIDYKKYPKNWKTEIRPAVLERAGNKCEFCGIKNHSIIKRLPDGTWRSPCQTEWDMIYSRIKYCHSNMTESLKYHGFIRVVLTIAHLDHDECNHEVKLDRLAALRDDSSFMQWFIYTKDLYDEDEELVHYKGEWDLCLEHRVADDDFYPELRRKATAKEIIKHFRYTELCLLSLVLSERIPKS